MNTVDKYYQVIPEPLLHGLNQYVERHVETGGFLRAVLEDKLLDAVVQADEESRKVLLQICHYVYNELPSACHGSPEKVRAWLSPQVRSADVLRRLGVAR